MDFLRLIRKEIKGSKWTIFIFIALTVIWHLFLFSRVKLLDENMAFSLAMLPFMILPLWTVGNIFQMLHTEWNTNSIYLLLSLPLRGWTVTGSKLTASLLNFFILAFLSFVSSVIFFGKYFLVIIRNINFPFSWFINQILIIGLFYLLALVVALVLAQFSYLISRLTNRFRGLVIGAIGFVLIWIYVRVGAFISPIFNWLPSLKFKDLYYINGAVQVSIHKINTAPIAAVLLLTIIFFFIGAWIYDKKIEV